MYIYRLNAPKKLFRFPKPFTLFLSSGTGGGGTCGEVFPATLTVLRRLAVFAAVSLLSFRSPFVTTDPGIGAEMFAAFSAAVLAVVVEDKPRGNEARSTIFVLRLDFVGAAAVVVELCERLKGLGAVATGLKDDSVVAELLRRSVGGFDESSLVLGRGSPSITASGIPDVPPNVFGRPFGVRDAAPIRSSVETPFRRSPFSAGMPLDVLGR